MYNKHFTLLALLLVFSITNTLAQCVIPITDGQPYTEDFQSDIMECWTIETTGSATWGLMAGQAVFQNASAGDEARLISPTFDMSGIGGATFSFSYAMMGLYPPYDELTVSYRTSSTDSWHTLGSYSLNDWNNSYEATFELPDISSTYQVSFLGHSNGGYYIFVDNIEIASAGGCARPVNLQALETTAFSALLSWSTTGNEESWLIDVNGIQKTVDAQPYWMEGLEPQTDYTLIVKAFCDNGSESEWSNPVTFKTKCDVIVVTDDEPYFDDFEASEEFICWTDEISSGDFGWAIDPGYLILNNTANFFWMGEEALLYSAPLDITAVTTPVLQFKHKQPQNEGVSDFLYVAYRTSPSDMWHVLGTYEYISNEWETETLTLPETSAELQIGFDAIANNGNGNGVYVDDVWVGSEAGVGVIEVVTITNGDAVIYDLFGRQVATAKFREGRLDFDMNRLASGIYIARISNEQGVRAMKIVKE